jgi:hypothetical protein
VLLHTYIIGCSVAVYCDVMAGFQNSGLAISRQWGGRCLSVDLDSQQYEAVAMIQHSKRYATVGWAVVAVGVALESYKNPM